MSTIKLSATFLSYLVIACAQTAGPVDPAFLLDRDKAGPFQAGMPVDSLYQLVGRSNVDLVAAFPEGMFQLVLNVKLPGFDKGPALTASIREWPCNVPGLWSISILDPRFRTVNGLGVGSTLGDLKRLYGTNLQVSGAEGCECVFIKEIGLGFALEPSRAYSDATPVKAVGLQVDPGAMHARFCPDRPFPANPAL